MKSPEHSVIRIGAWRVDPALDEISKDGKTVKLEPKMMRLLVCLAEHAGQVVSVDQLLTDVWKDVIVTPDSVYRAVATLRRELADDANEPTYIANVLRRGYRLIAPVAPYVDAQASDSPRSAAPEQPDALLETTASPAPAARGSLVRRSGLALFAALAVALAYLATDKFWVARPVATEHSMIAATTAAPDKSVAVLPFVNMSDDKDNEYFSDGLSEELIDLLTKIPELRVPAHTSSFYFKGKQATISDIAKALGVTHVLEGSVRKSGNILRITAQLVRVDNGYHLWSETYDRELGDIFKVQDEIAGAVVKALKVSLLERGVSRAAPSSSTEAYTLYLQARLLWERGTPADNQRAVDYLKRALQLDPKFAAAWALLAYAESVAFSLYRTASYAETRLEAHRAAEQALKLDPKLSDAHVALARILWEIDWERDAADAEIRQGLALDAGNADAFRVGAFVAISRGRSDEALARAQSSISRDPLSAWNYLAVAQAQWSSGRLTEAAAAFRKALELNPSGGELHSLFGLLLVARGDSVAGLAEIERETLPALRQVSLAHALDRLGPKGDADRELAAAEQNYAGEQAFGIAIIYADRNDPDRAFAWLDRAYRQHEWRLLYFGIVGIPPITVDPGMKNLRGDPRYKAFLRKINLPA